MLKDPRAVLGVDEKAGPEEIRRAYLRQAVKCHPDRNPGDPEAEERFKDLSQAYAVLSDPAARARYERERSARAGKAPKTPRPEGPRPEGARAGGPPPGGPPPRPGRTAAGAESPKAESSRTESPRTESPRTEYQRTESPRSESRRAEAGEQDWDEALANFFRTAKGRSALNDLERELKKAGLKFSKGDFARWLKARKPGPLAAARAFIGGLAERLSGAISRKKAARYDIRYELALSPEAAAAGTAVEISYLRDDRPCQLKVAIPPGVRDGARLRLPALGRLKPDKSRGDLELTLSVGRRPAVEDLWGG